MIPMVTNEVTYAAYSGHLESKSCPSDSPLPGGGTVIPSTSSVIATAMTASEKDSSRLVPICLQEFAGALIDPRGARWRCRLAPQAGRRMGGLLGARRGTSRPKPGRQWV